LREPLASIDRGAASLLAHRGVQASVVLAGVLTVIAAGVFLPAPAARGAVAAAIVVAALIWIGEDFGGIFTGSATDPNSGLLLALLAQPTGRPGLPGAWKLPAHERPRLGGLNQRAQHDARLHESGWPRAQGKRDVGQFDVTAEFPPVTTKGM